MQRYHSGRTRCQVNQEVASTDAPTPRIDSQPLWTDEAGRESADASIASRRLSMLASQVGSRENSNGSKATTTEA